MAQSKSQSQRQKARKVANVIVVELLVSSIWIRRAIYLAQILVLIFMATTTSFASRLALHPLYGSTATSLYFKHLISFSCILSALPISTPSHLVSVVIASLLAVAPFSAKHIGGWTGRFGSVTRGPIVTQLLLVVPIVGLIGILVRRSLKALAHLPYLFSSVIATVLLLKSIDLLEPVIQTLLPSGLLTSSCNMFQFSTILACILCLVNIEVKPTERRSTSTAVFLSAWPLVIPAVQLWITFSSLPCSRVALPATFSSSYSPASNSSIFAQMMERTRLVTSPSPDGKPRNTTVKLLARTNSVTGTIIVAEHVEQRIRFLRADHSLLGGRWILGPPHGNGLSESIYGAFTLQEGIRLVTKDPRDTENTLVIGLGVGIAADAFIRHGHKVHIVEIDPAVYTYARGFFGLSEPYAVDLVDARGWVHNRRQQIVASSSTHNDLPQEANKFSLVVHDCFSGGGVPEHIFTIEFWEELKGIMTSDGALAVNFVGHIGSPAARAIWFTLEKAFAKENQGRGCRVFHDVIHYGEEDTDHKVTSEEFLNMVFFCQKSKDSENASHVQFRHANYKDYLRSPLREVVLSTMLQRELTKQEITGFEEGAEFNAEEWILTDTRNPLGQWQHEAALEHWSRKSHLFVQSAFTDFQQ
ncbi:hypothetical protein CPB86DRAFT_873981 [Serendipita vermifera]|nr:hypothetical protein CPB86DRAFT_873981 [Serendipita vermifera]